MQDKNVEETFQDTNAGNDFFEKITEVQATKAELDKWDYEKHRSRSSAKEQTSPTEWKIKFSSYLSDKGLIL